MNLQLPSWMIKSLEETFGKDKSSQYYIKELLKECINSKEGEIIRKRIMTRSGI